MIGIRQIASYLPNRRKKNSNRIDEFSIDGSFLSNKLGVTEIAVKDHLEETSDMCVRAYENLQKNIESNFSRTIDCIAVCTQNPDGYGLPHTSAILHGKLDLPEACATFDISLGCSGYVYSLSLFQSFLNTHNFKSGILFTCDPYSKIINNDDKDTALLFGDAATATYFTEQPRWSLGKAVFGTSGKDWKAIRVGPDGKFNMQGRSVFNFAATKIPQNIYATLAKNGLSKDDIDLFILHQGSKYIIDVIARRMKVPTIKMPFSAGKYGNTVSSSIPMLLENIDQKAETVLLSGFGVGLSWGSMILKKV